MGMTKKEMLDVLEKKIKQDTECKEILSKLTDKRKLGPEEHSIYKYRAYERRIQNRKIYNKIINNNHINIILSNETLSKNQDKLHNQNENQSVIQSAPPNIIPHHKKENTIIILFFLLSSFFGLLI